MARFVIFWEAKADFFAGVRKVGGHKAVGWCHTSKCARKLISLNNARQVAQSIADTKGIPLLICRVEETDTPVGILDTVEITPHTASTTMLR